LSGLLFFVKESPREAISNQQTLNIATNRYYERAPGRE